MDPGRLIHQRYRIVGIIGEGGSGSVHLAEDTRLPGRRCAVKEVSGPATATPGPVELSTGEAAGLANEAAMLARLDHPGLPGVSDYFRWQGRFYMVMDYVPGDDLRKVLLDAVTRGRQLDELAVLRWADEVLDVLAYLHGQHPPVIHRDIKPANIKLTPDGQVRVVDLGLSAVERSDSGPTVTIVGGGSRAYQPLEQSGGEAVGPQADIYALGATLYHLLVGQAPPSAPERFLSPDALTPLRQARPGVSPVTAAAVAAAMALHPADRPSTVSDLRALLRASPTPASEWRTALRANAGLLAVLAILFLAALALSLWP